jgi:antitoxin (DNA-binding transcriptional repressor) of toxin-antitoxin stability system
MERAAAGAQVAVSRRGRPYVRMLGAATATQTRDTRCR